MSNEYILTSDGELYHYGVLGMKWGVRRYQNKSGSITREGVKRYNRVVAREETAARGTHGRKVLEKYEKLKTSEQKEADKWASEASRKLKQSRRDRNLGDDFDFWAEVDKPGSRIGKLFYDSMDANTVRAQAYAGAKWYNKYDRELGRAIDKDYREAGLYRQGR